MDFSDNDDDGRSDVSVTIEDILPDYEKAAAQFTIKLSHVQRYLPALRISLQAFLLDYYAIALSIPPSIDLAFYLVNYDTIASSKFLAHPAKGMNICRAIWYYNVDKNHSFSQHFDNVRYNVILMAILWAGRILQDDSVDALCDPSAGSFWYTYVLGWLESISDPSCFDKRDAFVAQWYSGDFDLIQFPRSMRTKITSQLQQIKNMIPDCDVPASEFIARCEQGLISRETFEREGPLLALRWALAKEEGSEVQGEMEQDAPEMEGNEWLFDVAWRAGHVKALMRDIEESELEKAWPPTGKKEWMSKGEALGVFDEIVDSGLAAMVEGLTMGGSKQEGESADVEMSED